MNEESNETKSVDPVEEGIEKLVNGIGAIEMEAKGGKSAGEDGWRVGKRLGIHPLFAAPNVTFVGCVVG